MLSLTANRIRNVTDNVRVGFGSFNDKATRPYTYFPEQPADGSPCPQCGPIYAFRHQITLTDDITFYNVIIAAECSFNNWIQAIVLNTWILNEESVLAAKLSESWHLLAKSHILYGNLQAIKLQGYNTSIILLWQLDHRIYCSNFNVHECSKQSREQHS
jgi:hypothetical protein